jgi:hypothetical protein
MTVSLKELISEIRFILVLSQISDDIYTYVFNNDILMKLI